GRTASVWLTLFGCLWLAGVYRDNIHNALLWNYAPEIVAICATTVAFCALSGCHFGRVEGRAALLAVQPAAYLDLALLSGLQSGPMLLLLAACAGILLLMAFLLAANLARGEAPVDAARRESETA
ncbi:MAG: hypothetical protein IJ617_08150, partial [Oscillospiraceae bacterium]|nr:hypothetical protein [Oscillospiraceae bacterium]